MVNLEPISVSRIETGAVLPSIVRLHDLAAALGVSMARLLGVKDVSAASHARELAALLDPLDPNDRSVLIGIVRQVAARLQPVLPKPTRRFFLAITTQLFLGVFFRFGIIE